MGKDIENFSAELNSPVYFAGQLIQGTVHFDCSEPVKSEGVFVELIGEARVHWTEREHVGTGNDRRSVTRKFHGHEKYVTQQKVCLYNPPNGYLPAGRYDMPFTLQIPYNAPSSFVGHYGTVMYKVVYNVHRPWKMAKKKVMGLSVCSVSDLNKVPEARNSIAVTNQKTFGVLMFKSKPLSMQIIVNKTGFVPGETIYINGFIDNKSNTKIKHCEVKLFQKVEYKASSSSITGGGISHSAGGSKTAQKLIQELQQPGLEPKSSEKWVNLAFHIPPAPPTGLDGCSLINLSYHMQIRVVPPGARFALEIDFPVFIGNIPLRDVAMPGQPQTGYPQQMPGQGGAGYPPQQMPGQGGAGYPPQQMPGEGAAGYPMFPGQDPSAPVMTMGAPPSYDELFKVQTHEQEDHEDYEFVPQYPTYEFSKD